MVQVTGMVESPAEFTVPELINLLPSYTIPVTLVCAGDAPSRIAALAVMAYRPAPLIALQPHPLCMGSCKLSGMASSWQVFDLSCTLYTILSALS